MGFFFLALLVVGMLLSELCHDKDHPDDRCALQLHRKHKPSKRHTGRPAGEP